MSACLRSMHELIETTIRRWPRDLHPCAKAHLHELFSEMRAAVDDPVRVVALTARVRRVVQELPWEAEDAESTRAFRDAYRLRRQADRIEGVAHDWAGEWGRTVNRQSAERQAERAESSRRLIQRFGRMPTLEEYLAARAQTREAHVHG